MHLKLTESFKGSMIITFPLNASRFSATLAPTTGDPIASFGLEFSARGNSLEDSYTEKKSPTFSRVSNFINSCGSKNAEADSFCSIVFGFFNSACVLRPTNKILFTYYDAHIIMFKEHNIYTEVETGKHTILINISYEHSSTTLKVFHSHLQYKQKDNFT